MKGRVEPALDGTHRNAKAAGHLTVLEPMTVDEVERAAERFR
jgi:hypothetical protein